MRKILEIKDLNVTFSLKSREIIPVKNVNFNLYEKEILAIVGESGSGKTTLVQAILKLIPSPPLKAVSGKIYFDDENILERSEKEILKIRGTEIAYITQGLTSSLNPTMKIGKQIKEAVLKYQKLPSKKAVRRAVSLLELVKITDPLTCFSLYPHEISGGMCQRVKIAIALAQNPRIIIADESTTALDATTQSGILNLLKKIQKKMSLSIIFISHDLALVSKICNRILVMSQGQVVEAGNIKNVLDKPEHPYTQFLISSAFFMENNLITL